MPVLIGVAALGTEAAQVLTLHREVQAAADSAAVSVASYYAAQYNQYSAALGLTSLNTQPNLTTQAQGVAATYGFVNGTNGATVTMNNPPSLGNFATTQTYPYPNYAFEVIVSQRHTPLLSSYWLKDAITVTARAVAVINVVNGSGANCILALGVSSKGPPPVTNQTNAITGEGTSPLNLQGCSVTTNSSDATSIALSGSAHINLVAVNGNLGGRASTVGGYSQSGTASVQSCSDLACSTPINDNVTPVTGAGATPDPYAQVTIPSGSTCSTLSTLVSPWNAGYMCVPGNNSAGLCFSNISSPNPIILNPGTYCGGISISGNGRATYTLSAGVYVLAYTTAAFNNNKNTGLTAGGGTNTMTGTGVTLVFTSNDGISYPTGPNPAPLLDISSLVLNLTAPTNGPTAGFVIIGDRSMPLGTVGQNGAPTGTQFVIVGATGATVTLNGTVYLPDGALSLEGTGFTSTNCSQIIANVIDLNNSGTLTIPCATNAGGTPPSTLFGAIPLLVE